MLKFVLENFQMDFNFRRMLCSCLLHFCVGGVMFSLSFTVVVNYKRFDSMWFCTNWVVECNGLLRSGFFCSYGKVYLNEKMFPPARTGLFHMIFDLHFLQLY